MPASRAANWQLRISRASANAARGRALGLAAFGSGGFLVDGGRGANKRPPPLTLRSDFPDEWRVLLMLDPSRAGVSGEAEKKAFDALPEFPEVTAAHICHLVLMKLVPGLKEHDITAFGDALTEIQAIVGAHFAPKQGGSAVDQPGGRPHRRPHARPGRDRHRSEFVGANRASRLSMEMKRQFASIIL